MIINGEKTPKIPKEKNKTVTSICCNPRKQVQTAAKIQPQNMATSSSVHLKKKVFVSEFFYWLMTII